MLAAHSKLLISDRGVSGGVSDVIGVRHSSGISSAILTRLIPRITPRKL